MLFLNLIAHMMIYYKMLVYHKNFIKCTWFMSIAVPMFSDGSPYWYSLSYTIGLYLYTLPIDMFDLNNFGKHGKIV